MKEVIGIELVTSEDPDEAAETAVEQGELALQVTKKKKYEEHELSSAVDCLFRSEEIKLDSELMKAIQPLIEKKKSAIKKLKGVRSISDIKDRMKDLEEES